MIGVCCRVIFPFTDASGAKDRPAVVIYPPDSLGDLSVLMITSQSKHRDNFAILPEDYREGALPKESWVRVERPLRIHQARVRFLRVLFNENFMRRLKKQVILRDTRSFSTIAHRDNRPGDDPLRPTFKPGADVVPYAGRVFTEDEVEAAVSSALDFWLTLGSEGKAFEKELAAYLGVRHSILVNSGSSANLLALSALTSHKLPTEKRIRLGDEVITVAAGFPTTVAPIIQIGAIPVFIDNDPITGNARVEMLEEAYVRGKTKAVMMAHTLGNPFDLDAVLEFCRKYDLWLIEDNCDSLGATYSIPIERAKSLGLDHLLRLAKANTGLSTLGSRLPAMQNGLLTAYTGSFGDLSTQSFYPPHHITMGEGGAVNIVRDSKLKAIVESFRDWGRDCWCASGMDNTCGKRFGWKLGELPEGYDHKYIYSHLGYNLKPLDLQAAIGRQQLKKLPEFVEVRTKNWNYLRAGLADLEEFFEFSLPTHAYAWTSEGFVCEDRVQKTASSANPIPSGRGRPSALGSRRKELRCSPSWFGFMLRVKPTAPFTNTDLARHLDDLKIGNRMLFGGNLLRQPVFVQLRKDRPGAMRVVGDLAGADELMNRALFLGTYPGLTHAMLDYEIDSIRTFVRDK